MPYLSIPDLHTHVYPEVITEITRNNDTIAEKAIAAAIREAKIYLGRYNLPQLFGDDDTEPLIEDEFLKSMVKDIASWHLIRLSNVSINNPLFRKNYEDTIEKLKAIMTGAANPAWPYKNTTAESEPDGNTIHWHSNPKRENYY